MFVNKIIIVTVHLVGLMSPQNGLQRYEKKINSQSFPQRNPSRPPPARLRPGISSSKSAVFLDEVSQRSLSSSKMPQNKDEKAKTTPSSSNRSPNMDEAAFPSVKARCEATEAALAGVGVL